MHVAPGPAITPPTTQRAWRALQVHHKDSPVRDASSKGGVEGAYLDPSAAFLVAFVRPYAPARGRKTRAALRVTHFSRALESPDNMDLRQIEECTFDGCTSERSRRPT